MSPYQPVNTVTPKQTTGINKRSRQEDGDKEEEKVRTAISPALVGFA